MSTTIPHSPPSGPDAQSSISILTSPSNNSLVDSASSDGVIRSQSSHSSSTLSNVSSASLPNSSGSSTISNLSNVSSASFDDSGSSTTHVDNASDGREEQQIVTPGEATPPSPGQSSIVEEGLTEISDNDVLDPLQKSAKSIIEVDDLIQSARKSIDEIRSFYSDKSIHRVARAVKKVITAVIGDYVKAVDSSVKTAQYGITFASNIIWLCQNLKKEPPSDVPAFMDEVGMIGDQALKQAEETRDAFSSVNRRFLQIIENIKNKNERNGQTRPAVVNALQQLADTTKKIHQHNENFVKWWKQTTQNIRTSHQSLVSTDDGQKICDSRIKMLQQKWQDVCTRYEKYDVGIGDLVAEFPQPPAPRSFWNRLVARIDQ